MKIAIEAQRIFRQKKHGMDVVAIELIRNIQDIDRENEYHVFARTGVNDLFSASPNFHFHTFSSATYADWEQLNLPVKLKNGKFDLLHCTANTAPILSPVPFVVTIHDIIYLEQLSFKGSSYQNIGNLYRRFVVPENSKKARLIITVSEFEKENIVARLKLPPEKVKVLYNGVGTQFNTDYDSSKKLEFRTKYGLPAEFIMFLGNTAPKKNTHNVIRAYVDYCDKTKDPIPLVILDYKKEAVLKTLQQLNKPEYLRNFVFPGYVPYSNIPLLYNSATLFLYPSLRESFGMPVLEAMACGVPVITSNTSSMPEVAGDAAEFVDPFDYQDLSRALCQMLSDGSRRDALRQKGLERVQHFTWKRSAQELVDIYHKVLS